MGLKLTQRRKMKSIFVLASVLVLTQALPQSGIRFEGDQTKPIKQGIDVDTRAPSDYNNCNCQCDSYSWVDSSGYRAGNCRASDRTGARFCYVSGSALCACRDVRISQSRPNNFNGPLYYSYEACATPRQDSYECRNDNGGYYGGNFGDGDYPYCRLNSGFNANRPTQPFRPNRPIQPSRPNRPFGGSFGSSFGSSGSSFNGPFREGGSGSGQSLDDILNGKSSNDNAITFA